MLTSRCPNGWIGNSFITAGDQRVGIGLPNGCRTGENQNLNRTSKDIIRLRNQKARAPTCGVDSPVLRKIGPRSRMSKFGMNFTLPLIEAARVLLSQACSSQSGCLSPLMG